MADIRSVVIKLLIEFLRQQPVIRRPARLPTLTSLTDQVKLSALAVDDRGKQILGRYLTRRNLCAPLPVTTTRAWRTIGDVIITVTRHPAPNFLLTIARLNQ